ncbi:MAG TPA: molybdopterin-binding protein, partial [Acidimicrobiia bacterium]|nr:molybdopterin-binding protein [Acidimicrobiia bacterium]
MTLQAKVLTVSDGVAGGTRADKSGRALVEHLAAAGYDVVAHEVTGDGAGDVERALRALCDGFSGLVVTTGGT